MCWNLIIRLFAVQTFFMVDFPLQSSEVIQWRYDFVQQYYNSLVFAHEFLFLRLQLWRAKFRKEEQKEFPYSNEKLEHLSSSGLKMPANLSIV